MKNLSTIDLLEGSPSRNLLALFLPLMIAFFFSMAFDINDSLWIGNLLGQKALAAQTVSLPLILIYNAICMGVTGGVGILLSQSIGAKEQDTIEKLITTSAVGLLIFSLIITIVCELSVNAILAVVNTPAEIYATARGFLLIHILSFPFVMMYMYLSAVLRSYGNSTVQLTAIIGCTALNAVFDPVFIHFMGMNGVAVATVISEGIMMVLVFLYCKKHRIVHMHLRAFHFETLRQIAAKAVPSMVQQSLPSISAAFITSLVAIFGVVPLAGFGTAGRIEIFLLYPPMAMNMALTSATGQCFGAQDIQKAKEYMKWGVLWGGGVLMIFTLIVVLFSSNLAMLFGVDKAVSRIVSSYFAIIAAGYVCNMITNNMLGTINGSGKPATGMWVMIFYYIVIRVPLAKMLSITVLGLKGIWIAVLISHIVAAIASMLCCKQLMQRKSKPEQSFASS